MIIAGRIAHHFVNLRFDFFPLPLSAHIGGIDFIIEVPNIADHCT